MTKNTKISIQEFTEKYFPEIMKNTFHADFIDWLYNETKDLSNSTPILLQGGRSKSFYHKFNEESKVKVNGIHATHIIVDDLASKTP